MIISLLLVTITGLINLIFGILPDIPQIPTELSSLVDSFFDLIFDNSGLVGFFVPISTIKIALPIAIVIINFEHIYSLVMWVVKKIPMLNLK